LVGTIALYDEDGERLHTTYVAAAPERGKGEFFERMDYALLRAMDLPIGSGVTEAACKCIVKARLCGSGMRWDSKGASEVLRLRTMIKSDGRWEQFWDKVSRYGFSRITAPKRTKREKSDQSESGKNN